MFFARALFSLFAVGAVGALASSAPSYDKDITSVVAIALDLEAQVKPILVKIDALADAQIADEASVAPVLETLVQVLVGAQVTLQGLEGKVNPVYGGKDAEVAKIIANVYLSISASLGGLKDKKPHLVHLIAKLRLDVALFKVLLGLNIVVAGVLKLVAGLLVKVGVVLSNLSLTLVINLLGYYGGYGY